MSESGLYRQHVGRVFEQDGSVNCKAIAKYGDGLSKDKKESGFSELQSLVNKVCGEGAFQILNKKSTNLHPAIPTGIRALDKILGIGGFPIGRSVELYGENSSGKTTTALTAAASAQQVGYIVLYIDAEHALNVAYAVKLGIDLDRFGLTQPSSAEEVINLVQTVLESGQKVFIVIDSVAALTPKAETEGDAAEAHMGLMARLMARFCRKITGPLGKSECVLLLLNQIRQKIGVMFGNPNITTGGKSLPFFASMRIEVRRGDKLKSGEAQIGNKTKFVVVKNRMGTPYQEAEADLVFGEGFDSVGSVFDAAVSAGVIEKSGAWYSYAGERLGQGRDAAKSLLKSNIELLTKIEAELKAKESL